MTVDCVVVPTLWIPAYAGMTVGSDVGFTLEDFSIKRYLRVLVD